MLFLLFISTEGRIWFKDKKLFHTTGHEFLKLKHVKINFLEIKANGRCNSCCNYVSKNKLKKRSFKLFFHSFLKIKTFVIDKLKWVNNLFNKKNSTQRLHFFHFFLFTKHNPLKHYKIWLGVEITQKKLACLSIF